MVFLRSGWLLNGKICKLFLKKSQHPDRKGGGKGGGVNPYGQPDLKNTGFFYGRPTVQLH